jgi:hypothetical protein
MKRLHAIKGLVVPIVGENNFSIREEAASKIGFFAMCCFKSLIAARLATSGSFIPVSAIVGNASITISKA